MSKPILKLYRFSFIYLLKNMSTVLASHGNKNEIMKSRPNGTIDFHSSKPEAA